MKIKLGTLREIIRKTIAGSHQSEAYDKFAVDDPSFNKKSIHVSDNRKKQIKKFLKDLGLSESILLREATLISPKDNDSEAEAIFNNEPGLREILKKFNVKIVLRNTRSGASGRVYEVTSGDDRIALKVTTNMYDAEQYKKLSKIRDELPDHVARSMPVIYDQVEIDQEGAQRHVFGTLMEFLVHPPKSVSQAGWGVSDRHDSEKMSDTIAAIKKEKREFIKRLDLYLWRSLSGISDKTKRNHEYNEIKNSVEWQKFKKYQSELVDDGISLLGQFIVPVVNDIITHDLLGRLSSQWLELPSVKRFARFPTSGDKTLEINSHIKDRNVINLIKSLQWMTKNGFLRHWNDVYADNVMMRPSTSDLVVADVGAFEFV